MLRLVIDTLADTIEGRKTEGGKTAAAPNSGFREKRIYMLKDGKTEIFTPDGKRVRGE